MTPFFPLFSPLAAEVLPQRAADRAGEEGGVGCTLPECEFLILVKNIFKKKFVVTLLISGYSWNPNLGVIIKAV